jgi:hypothetical protein
MKDEDCFPITAFRGAMEAVDAEGDPCIVEYVLTGWLPNKEDIEAFLAGRPVMIRTLGHRFQPMAVFTFNEEGEPND